MPALSRQTTRALVDPVLHETRALTEVETLLNEMRAGIPGYSSDLPPRRNLWGDAIELTGGWGPDLISPIYTSPVKHDPVSDEIVRLKVRVSLPQPLLFGGREPRALQFDEPRPAQEGVPLTPGEYDLLLRLVGKGVGDNGPLKDRLAAFIASEEYRGLTDGPDGSRALGIARYVDAYKQAARAAMLDDNINPGAQALRDALEAKRREKAKALTPGMQGSENVERGKGPMGAVRNMIESLGQTLGR